MIQRVLTVQAGLFAAFLIAVPALARGQTAVTLDDAMARARANTPAARALASASDEAAARVQQARAGYLPRVDISHSVQRGNQPVFVFSSLLSQGRFAAENFDIARLNDPAAITNVASAISIEQPVFDAGRARLAVRGAELGRDLATAERLGATQDLAIGAARAFLRVLQLEAADRAATAAVAAAESDLERARARREVGLETDAAVFAVDVQLAEMRQRQISATGELAVARVQLNDLLGLPLDQPVMLVTPVASARQPDADALVREAFAARPERAQSALRVQLAENARRTAQSAFLPAVGVQAGWAFNSSDWTDQRSSWIVGAQVRVNVFSGFADAARVAEARHAETRAAAERERTDRSIEVDVRAAIARLEAARAREEVGRAALAQARESQRIVRDRYDGGLATVTDVLYAAEAVLDAESRATAAEMDVILQTVALDRAIGRL